MVLNHCDESITMSRSSAFEPIWPPANDEDFEAWPEVREARKMYQSQKHDLRKLVEITLIIPPGTETVAVAQDIATMLHNLSGTAAHFGERPFGRSVGELEQPVRGAFTADLLHPFCTRILSHLDHGTLD